MSDLTSNSAAKSNSETLSETSSTAKSADLVAAAGPPPLASANISGDGTVAKSEPTLFALVVKTWWIPASYLVPYLITLLFNPVISRSDNLLRAGKVGAIGLGAALLIAFVWFLDSNFGARQIFAASRDKAAKALVLALMVALWISWLCVGITMVMTFDQVNSPNSSVPVTRQP